MNIETIPRSANTRNDTAGSHRPDPRPIWKAIITSGGLMPVSSAERERFRRVQETLRAVFGLPEDAPEEQLIDVRERDRRTIRARAGDERSIRHLAELYLRDYARRLDPDDPNLEPVDRAALAWRDATADETAPDPSTWYEQPPLIPGRWAALPSDHFHPANL
jgi:hypothetical protein